MITKLQIQIHQDTKIFVGEYSLLTCISKIQCNESHVLGSFVM